MATSKEENIFYESIKFLLVDGFNYHEIIKQVDGAVITLALKKFRGNQVRTSKFLKICRNTLRTKMKKLGLL